MRSTSEKDLELLAYFRAGSEPWTVQKVHVEHSLACSVSGALDLARESILDVQRELYLNTKACPISLGKRLEPSVERLREEQIRIFKLFSVEVEKKRSMVARWEEKEREYKSLEEKINHLNSTLLVTKRESIERDNLLTTIRNDYQNMVKELTQLSTERERLQSLLAQTQQTLGETSDQCRGLIQENSSLKSKFYSFSEEVRKQSSQDSLSQQLAMSEKLVSSLKEKLGQYEHMVQREQWSSQEINRLRGLLDSSQRQVNSARQDQQKEAEIANKAMADSNSRLQEIHILKTRIIQLESEVALLNSKLGNAIRPAQTDKNISQFNSGGVDKSYSIGVSSAQQSGIGQFPQPVPRLEQSEIGGVNVDLLQSEVVKAKELIKEPKSPQVQKDIDDKLKTISQLCSQIQKSRPESPGLGIQLEQIKAIISNPGTPGDSQAHRVISSKDQKSRIDDVEKLVTQIQLVPRKQSGKKTPVEKGTPTNVANPNQSPGSIASVGSNLYNDNVTNLRDIIKVLETRLLVKNSENEELNQRNILLKEKIQQLEESIFFREQQEANTMPSPSATRLPREAHHHNQHTSTSYVTSQQAAGQIPQAIMQEVQQYIGEISRLSNIAYQLDSTVQNQALSISQYAEQLTTMTRKCYELEQSLSGAHNELTKVEEEKKVLEEKLKEEVENRENDQELQLARAALKAESEMYTKQVTVLTKRLAILEQRVKEESTRLSSIKSSEREHELHLSNLNTQIATLEREGAARIQEKAIELAICKKLAATAKEKLEVLAKEKAILEKETISTKNRVRMAAEETRRQLAENALLSRFVKELENIPSGIPPQDVHKHLMMIGELSKRIVSVENKLRDQTVKLKEFQEEEEALMTQLLVIISRVCEAELEDNDNQEENRIEEFYDALDATSDRLINVIKVNDALEEENIRDIQYIRRTIGDMNNNLLQIGILAHMVKELLRIPPGPQQDEYNRYIEVAAELTAKLSRSESIITAQTADIVEQAETEKRLAKEVLELAERLRDRGYSPHSSDRSRIDRRTEDILDIRRDVETLAKIVKKEIGSHSEIPSRDGETNQQVTFAQSVNTQSQVQISSLKKRVEELEVQVRKDLDMIALLTSILEEAEKEIKEYRQEHAELRRAKEERTLLESKILKLETLANTQQGLNKEGKEELAKYKELAMEANEKYKSLLVVMSEKDKQAEAEAKARLEERKKVEQLTKKIQELEQIPPGVPAEQVQAHLSKISQLSNQLKETNTKLSTQQEQLQNLQKEEQDHINLLMTLTRKIKSLENEEMASPMIVQGKLRVEIDKYKNILEKTSGRIKTLGEQNKQLETLHNTDKAARDKAMTEANTHLQQVQLLTQKIRTLEQSSGEAKQEIDNYLHKVKDLTEKLSAAESDMMKKTSRIESFELSERRSKEEIMRLTDKIRTLEMENSRNEGLAGQKAEELTATKTQLEHALHTLQKERDQRSIIEEQKKFTEKQAAVAKQESDKYFKQIHELQAKITQVDSSRGVDKEEMDSLILSVSKLNNKISELEDQNNFLSSESYKLKVERDDLKKQTESLTKEMDELRLSYSKSVVAPPPTILPVQPPSSRTDSALAPSFINESVVMNKETAQQKGEDINVIVLESINLDSRIGEEEVLTEELAALTTWISEHPQAGVLQPLQNQLEQKLKTLLTMRANVECKIREKRESFSISRQLTFLLALCKDLELLVPSRPAVIRNIASEIERLLMIRASAFSKVRVILMVAALVADYLNNQAMSPAERSMLEKVIADSSEELKHLEITLRNAENELVRNETELRQHLMQANTLVLENLQQLRTPEQTSDDRVNRLKALSERLTAVEKGSPAKLDIPPLVLSGTSREIAENARSLLARLFTRAASRAELSLYRKMIAALAAQTKTLAQTIINPESSGVIEGSQNLSGLEAQIAELTVCLNDLQNVIRIKQSPGQKDKAEVQKFVGILLNRMVPVPSGSLEYSSGLGLEQSKLSPEDIDLYRDMLKEASQREREKVSVPMFESQTLSPSPMMRGRGLRNQLKSPSDDKSQLSLVYSLSDQLGVLENKLDEQSQLLSKMEREKESQFARLSFISDQLANPSAERSSHLQPLLKEATQRLKKITEEEKKIKDARKALIISAQAVLEEGKKKLGSLSYIPPLQQVESKDVTPRNAGSPTAGLQAIAALIQQFTDSEVFLKKSQDELERWKQADMKFEEPFTKVAQIVDSEIQSGNEPILREQLRHLGASFQTFKAPSEYNREEVNTYGNDFAQREAVLMIRIKELEEEVAKFREESGLTKAEEEELRKKINVVSGKVKELEKKEIESGLSKSKLEEMRMLKSFLKDYKSKLDKHEKDKERKVSRVIREGGKLAEKETELEEEKKMNERLNSELERKTHEIEQITSNLNSLRAVSEAAFGQLEQLHDREDMYKSQIEQLTSRAEELEQTGQAYAGLAGKEHEQIMTLKAKLNDAVRRARQATLEQNRTKHILEKIREQSGQQRAAPVTQIVQQPQQQPADVSQYVSQIEQLTANLNSLRAVSEAAFGQLEQLHDREDMYKSQIEQLTSRAEELEQTGQAYAGLAGKEHEQIMTLKAKLNDAVRRARQATLEQNRTKHILEKIREQSGQQRAAPVTQIVQQPQQQPADVSQYVSQIEQLTANLNSLRAVSEAAFGQLEQLHDREDMYKSQIEQLTSRAEELEQTGQAYAGLAGKEHEQIMTLKAKLNDAVRRARQATLEQNRTKHILEKIREQSGQQRAAPVTQIVQQPQQQPADVSQYVSQIEQLTANLNSLRAVSEAAFGQLEQLHDREDMYKSQIEQLTSRAEELEQTGQAYAGLAGKEHEQIMTLKAKLNDAVRRARQATLEQNRTKHILEKIREQSGQQRAAPVTQIVQQPQQQPADVSQYVSQIEQLTANLNSLRAVSEAAFGQLEQLHDREDMYKSQIEQLTSRAEELEQTGQAYAGLAGKEHEQIMTLKAKLNDAVRRARQATLEQNRTKHILEKIREQSGQQRAAPVTQIVQQPQQQPADVSQYVSQIEQLTANLNSLRAVSEAAFGQLEQLHDREDMYKSQIEQLTSRAEELEQTGQAYAGLAGKEHEQIMTLKAKLNDAVRRARQATLEQNRTKHILEKIREQSGQQRAAPVTQIVQQPQQQPADVSQYVSQIEQLTANLNSLRAVSEAAFGQLEQLHDREDMYKSQIEQLTSRAEELEQTGQAYAGLAGKEHEQIMTLKAKLNDAVRRARQATLEQNRTKHILEKIREQSGQQRAAPVTQIVQQPQQQPADVSQYVSQIEQLTANLNSLRAVSEAAFGQLEQLHDREDMYKSQIEQLTSRAEELEQTGQAYAGLAGKEHEQIMTLKAKLNDAVRRARQATLEQNRTKHILEKIREQSGQQRAAPVTQIVQQPQQQPADVSQYVSQIEQLTANLNSLRAVSEAAFGQLEQLHDREDMYKSQIEQLTSRAEELEQTGQAYAGLAGKEHEHNLTLKAKLNDAVRRARQATLEQNRTKHILEKIREQSGQQRAAPVTQIVQQPQQQPADVSQYVSQIEQLTANLNSLRAVSEAAFGQLEQLHDREDMYKSQIEQLTSRAEELEQTGQAYAGLAGKEHEQIMTLKAKLNDAVRRARQATLEQNRTKHILEKIREQSGQQRAAPVTQIVQQPQQQPADVSQYVSQIEQLTANLNSLRAVSEAAFGQLEQLHDREDMYKSQIEQLTSRAEELEQTGQAYAGLAGKEHEQIMTLKAKLNDAVRRARQATLEQNRTKHILEKIREQSGQQRAAPVTQIVQQPQQQPADVSQYVSQIEQLTANLNSLRAVSEAAFGQLEQLHDREDMYKSQIEQLTSRAEELEQTGQAYAGLAGKEHEQIMTLKAKLNDAVRRARQATLEQNRTKHILEKIREQSGQQRAAPVTQIVQQPQQQPADVSQYVSQIEQLTANLNSLRAVSEAAFGQLEQLHDREDMYKSQIEQLTSRAEELEQTGQAYAGLAGKEHEQIMTLKAKLNDAVRRARQATLEQNRTKHILEKIREQSGQQRAAPVTQIVQQPQQQPADVSQYVSQIEQLTANLNSLRAVSEAAFGQLEQLHDREDMYKSQIEQLTSRAEELEQTGQAYAGLAGKEHEQIMTLKAKLNDAVRRARQATLEQNRTKHILEKIREQSGQQRAAPVTQIVQQPQQQPADVSQYVSQIEQLTANLNSLRAVSEAAFGQLEQLHDREDMYKSQIEQLTSRAEELEQTGQAYAGLAGKEHEQIMTLKAKLNDAVRRARQATLEQNRTKHILEKIREQSGQQRAAPVTQIVQQPQQQPADVSQYVSQIEQLTANLNSLRAVSEAAFGQLEQLHDREDMYKSQIEQLTSRAEELEQTGQAYAGLAGKEHEQIMTLKAKLNDAVRRARQATLEQNRTKHILEKIREQSGQQRAAPVTQIVQQPQQQPADVSQYVSQIEQLTANLNSLRAVSEAAFGQLEQLHDREDMYKSQIEQLTSRAEELEQTGQAYAGLAGKEHEQIMTLKAKLNDAVRRARQATLEQNRTKHILEKIREQSGQQRAAPVTQIVQQPQQQPADVSQYVSQIEQLTANLNSLRAVSEAAFGQLEQLHDREDMYKSQIEQLTSRAEELEQTGQAYAGLAGKEHEHNLTLKAKLNDAVRRARQATLEQNRTKHILEKIREQSGQQRAAPVTQIVQQPQQQPADVSQYVSQIEQLTANLNSLRAVSEAAFGQLEQLHDREDMYKSQIEQLTSRAEELEQTGQAYAGLAGKEHEHNLTLKAKLNDAVRRARQATLEQNRTKHILEKIREQSGQQRAAPVTQIVQQPQQQPADVSQYVSQIEQLTANLNSLRAVSEAAFGQLEQLHDREDMYKSQIEQLTSRAEELEQTGQAYAGLAGKEHEQIMTLKAKLNDAVRRARQATLEQNRTKHILEKIREQSGQQRAAPVTQIVQQPQQQPADVSQYVSQIEQLTANLNSLRAVSEAAFGQLEQLHDREDMYKSQIEQLTSRAEELEQTGQAYAGLAGKEHEQIMTLKAKLNDAVRRARQATLEQNRTKHILEKIREQSGQQRAAPVTQIVQQPQQQPADVSQYVSQIEQLTANLNSLRAVSEAAFGQLEQLHDREDMYKSQIEQLTSRAEELEQTGQAYAGLAGKEHEQIMTLKAKLNDAVRRARQATLEQNRTKHILEKIREQSGQQRAAPVTQIVQQPQQQPADVSQYVSQIEQLTANLNSLRAVSEAAFGQLEQLHDREDMYKSQIEQLTSRAEELEQSGRTTASQANHFREQINTLKAKLSDSVSRHRTAKQSQEKLEQSARVIEALTSKVQSLEAKIRLLETRELEMNSDHIDLVFELNDKLLKLESIQNSTTGQLEDSAALKATSDLVTRVRELSERIEQSTDITKPLIHNVNQIQEISRGSAKLFKNDYEVEKLFEEILEITNQIKKSENGEENEGKLSDSVSGKVNKQRVAELVTKAITLQRAVRRSLSPDIRRKKREEDKQSQKIIEEHIREVQELKDRVKELEETASEREDEIKNCYDRIDSQNIKIKRLEKESSSSFSSQLQVFVSQLNMLAARNQELERHFGTPHFMHPQGQVTIGQALEQNNQLTRKLAESEQLVLTLRDRLEQYQEKIDKLSERLLDANAAVKQRSTLQARITELENALEKAKAKTVSEEVIQESEIDTLQQEVSNLHTSLNGLTHRIRTLALHRPDIQSYFPDLFGAPLYQSQPPAMAYRQYGP